MNEMKGIPGGSGDVNPSEAEASLEARIREAKDIAGLAAAVTSVFEEGGYDFKQRNVPEGLKAAVAGKIRELVPDQEAAFAAYDEIRGSLRTQIDETMATHIPWLHDEKYKDMPREQAFAEMERDREAAFGARDRKFGGLSKAELFLISTLGDLLE
jgi:hypothetical protein